MVRSVAAPPSRLRGRRCGSATSPGLPAAADWRRDIRTWVDEGLADTQIQQRLEQRVGRSLSGTPGSLGGWLLPVVVTSGSLVLLGWLLRRWLRQRPEAAQTAVSAEVDAQLEAMLERELKREDS